MLEVLHRAEDELFQLTVDRGAWHSLLIDDEEPTVERLWRPMGDYRIYLHRIHPCRGEPLFHTHNWRSAIRIVSGIYLMRVGFRTGFARNHTQPPPFMDIRLRAGNEYDIYHPGGYHSVSPEGGPSCSVMVTDKPWNSKTARKSNRPLGPLTEAASAGLFEEVATAYLHRTW